jgi:hypothetical protein
LLKATKYGFWPITATFLTGYGIASEEKMFSRIKRQTIEEWEERYRGIEEAIP